MARIGWRSRTRQPRTRLRLEQLEQRVLLTAEVEPNNTLTTATAFLTSDTLTGTVASAGDFDYFRTTLTPGRVLRVRPGTVPGQLHFAPAVEVLDNTGSVVARSRTGYELAYTAPAAGPYYVRLAGDNAIGTFTGSYSIGIMTNTFPGIAETEPNDTPAAATLLTASMGLRGSLDPSRADVDFFAFDITAGRRLVLKLGNLPELNPAVRVYRPDGTLLAAATNGAGIDMDLPVAGRYRFALQGDNDAGPVNGEYVVQVAFVTAQVVEHLASDSFTGAPPWTIATTLTRATGALTAPGDVDAFAVQLRAGRFYEFLLESVAGSLGTQSRIVSLYNDHGQFMEYTTTGALRSGAATGFGFRVERTGRHFLTVQANHESGLGGYVLSGRETSVFPTQRDGPLVFHDYTGQSRHLGYGPAVPLVQQTAVPLLVGMYEARYDIYDVDVTLTQPTGAYLGFGMGEFGSIGAYGYGGSFNLGTRRLSGDSLVDDPGAGWSSLASVYRPASVMNQEVGHGNGLYAHARHPLSYMGYDTQGAQQILGTYFPFPWTTSSVPDVEIRNERAYLDWSLQTGRNADEVEPNEWFDNPQDLDPFLAEMRADGDRRNDRIIVNGRSAVPGDLDVYALTLNAGEFVTFDIDAAEFQVPLDATLYLLDPFGNLVNFSADALDRESGIASVDPYVSHYVETSGPHYLLVYPNAGTVGNYRLKVTPASAWDFTGPRVLGTWPNGGSSSLGTRQLMFWFNQQIDPVTLTAQNVIIRGNSTGVRSGTAWFDPTDASLVWTADVPLPPDTYTVTLQGVTDLRYNVLDGETDGALNWPEVSGDGVPGGDFTTRFTITGPDTTPATNISASYRRHPYNRGLITLNFNDQLDVASVYSASIVFRGTGPDTVFGTADDTFTPVDILYDKIKSTGSARPLEIFTRGIPDVGRYRIEGSFRDAAGNTVNLSRVLDLTGSTLSQGPVVAELNVQPGTVLASAPTVLEVTFSGALNPATLTNSTFVVRYSPDATFFDNNDMLVDGYLYYEATTHQAMFWPYAALPGGYYLIELSGGAGGITDPQGRLLDGEYLDSNIFGSSLLTAWRFAPSGDGTPGGDYRAMFIIAGGTAPGGAPRPFDTPPDYPESVIGEAGDGRVAGYDPRIDGHKHGAPSVRDGLALSPLDHSAHNLLAATDTANLTHRIWTGHANHVPASVPHLPRFESGTHHALADWAAPVGPTGYWMELLHVGVPHKPGCS